MNQGISMQFWIRVFTIMMTALGLASCGGGGGGDSSGGGGSNGGSSIITDATKNPTTCSNSTQLSFVRNHIDKDYLFYKGAPSTSAAGYTGTPDNFFYDLTTRAQPAKDRFSFVITAAEAQAVFQSGIGTGVGLDTRRDAQGRLRIALIEPGSPASVAGLKRGDRITSINGATVGASMTAAQSNALYYSSIGTSLSLEYQRLPSTATQVASMKASTFTSDPVPLATTISSNGSTVGYIAFHEHTAPSETKLADAFRTLSKAGVSDLVLDLRYNGGGYISIASQVAYMIAGTSTRTADMPAGYTKTFDRLEFNDKRSAENFNFGFLDYIYLDTARKNEILPSLNLKKVYILTTGSSCSASEAIINGLRGIDIEVITIGKTTCGKPFGMYQTDNCDNSYFALAFQGFNAKGFGDFTSGMTPTCSVSDDLDHELANPAEGLLATALTHRATGLCPAVVATGFATSAGTATLSIQDNVQKRSWGTSILNIR